MKTIDDLERDAGQASQRLMLAIARGVMADGPCHCEAPGCIRRALYEAAEDLLTAVVAMADAA